MSFQEDATVPVITVLHVSCPWVIIVEVPAPCEKVPSPLAGEG